MKNIKKFQFKNGYTVTAEYNGGLIDTEIEKDNVKTNTGTMTQKRFEQFLKNVESDNIIIQPFMKDETPLFRKAIFCNGVNFVAFCRNTTKGIEWVETTLKCKFLKWVE